MSKSDQVEDGDPFEPFRSSWELHGLQPLVQNPSPSVLTILPSWDEAALATKDWCSTNRTPRSDSGSWRSRAVEPDTSVFMMTVAQRL